MMSTRSLVGRILCPVLLLFLAASQLAIGGNALPTWLAVIAQRSNQDPVTYLRILIMAEATIAFLILFMGSGRRYLLSQAALLLIAFVSLAECAAAIRSRQITDVVAAAIFLAIALGFQFALMKSVGKAPESTPPRRRAPGMKGIGFVLIVISIGVAANAALAPRSASDGAIAVREAPSSSTSGRVIEMTPPNWVGRSIRETPIAQFVPDVIDLLGDDGILVLYNPRCGTCHDMFDVYFSGEEMELPIVALEIPPTENAILAESEYSDQVDCPTCEFTKLPDGPMWLVGVPYVMRVVNETVTCVGKDGPEGCLDL